MGTKEMRDHGQNTDRESEEMATEFLRQEENPDQWFREDPLSMLRLIRAEQQFGWVLSSKTTSAMHRQSYALVWASPEGIRDELAKTLILPSPDHAIISYINCNLMRFIIPEVEAMIGVDQSPRHCYDAFHHSLLVLRDVPARLPLRLAALLHDIGKTVTRSVDEAGHAHFYGHEDIGAKMASDILRRLEFPDDIVDTVSRLVQLHMRVNAYTPKWSRRAVQRLVGDARSSMSDLIDLSFADQWSDRGSAPYSTARCQQVRANILSLRNRIAILRGETEVVKDPSPLNGHEIMHIADRGPGPWIKEIKGMLSLAMQDGMLLPDDKEAAIQMVRQYLE